MVSLCQCRKDEYSAVEAPWVRRGNAMSAVRTPRERFFDRIKERLESAVETPPGLTATLHICEVNLAFIVGGQLPSSVMGRSFTTNL